MNGTGRVDRRYPTILTMALSSGHCSSSWVARTRLRTARAHADHHQGIFGIEDSLKLPAQSGGLQWRGCHTEHRILHAFAVAAQKLVGAAPSLGLANVVGNQMQLSLFGH
jgi:hypothetical protein